MQWRTTVKAGHGKDRASDRKGASSFPLIKVIITLTLLVTYLNHRDHSKQQLIQQQQQLQAEAEKPGWISNTFSWVTKWGGKAASAYTAINPLF
jgi:hypothetical protein